MPLLPTIAALTPPHTVLHQRVHAAGVLLVPEGGRREEKAKEAPGSAQEALGAVRHVLEAH